MISVSDFIPALSTYIANDYLRALVVFVVAMFILRLALRVVQLILVRITKATTTDLDDKILSKLSVPMTLVAFILAGVLAVQEANLPVESRALVDNTIWSLVVIIVAYGAYITLRLSIDRVWRKVAEKLADGSTDDTLINLANNVITIILFIITIIYIFDIWGVQIGPLLAGLGIAGLAVALALQPTLASIFSGVSLAVSKTIHVGDVIKLGSGEMGIVHRIGLRSTRIKTFDNELFIIPNTKLDDAIIQNFYLPDKSVRVNIEYSVEYGTDPEFAKLIVIEEIKKIKFIDKKQEINVLFLSMGDNALLFKVMFWVDDIAKKWPAHQEGITRIYRRLYKEKIGIPYPQMTVWLNDEGKAKPKSPMDAKFKKTHNKYYPKFGRKMDDK